MTNLLRVLLVGCGNIAGRLDAGRKGAGAPPLTHAGAYSRDGRFELAACVEPDEERRQEFMRDWGIALGFRSIEEVACSSQRFDVVSVCSPTQSHEHDLSAALGLEPELVFSEKPVTASVAQTQRLVTAYEKTGIHLAVNYTRRWDPAVADLRKGIGEGRWGRLRSVVGYYNKGLLNNGSHMVDLLGLLLGPLRVVHVGSLVDDFSPDDPSLPFWLEAAGEVPVQVVCGRAEDFALFELQLVFADALVSMEEGGMFWRERKAVPSAVFAGYRIPAAGVRRAGGYAQAMLRSVDNIFGAVRHAQALASNGESALAAQRLCEEIRGR